MSTTMSGPFEEHRFGSIRIIILDNDEAVVTMPNMALRPEQIPGMINDLEDLKRYMIEKNLI